MLAIFTNIILQARLFEWTVSILGLGLFLLGAIVFAQDTTKRRGKFFLMVTAVTALWGMALMANSNTQDASLFHATLVSLFLITGLIPLILFLFFYIFPTKDESFFSRKGFVIFAPYVIIAGTVLVSDFIVKYGEVYPETLLKNFLGKGYLLYVGYITLFLGMTFKVLFDKYRTSVGIFSAQSRSILIAFVITTSGALVGAVLSPHPVSAYNAFLIGYAGVVASVAMLGFILIKYNFWSFNVVATEFLATVFVVFLPASFFFTTSLSGLTINVMIAIFVVLVSFFIVESVKSEINSRDEIARLSSELVDMRARLKVLNKKKSEFLEVASHHLRDPLTAIKGYSSMLLEGSFGELVPPVRDAVEKIFESSKRLVTMISDFMDISNIESGDMQYDFAKVDIKKVVIVLVESMQAVARHSGVKLDTLVEGHGGAGQDAGQGGEEDAYTTIADIGKIRQVILSLVDNAIKYTPRGNVSVLLALSPDKSRIVFSVTDTGIGMSEITMEKIFKKFSRAESANKTYTEGIGLGLYVAKEIIKKHNGEIWAISKGEGMGSTFYVELPRQV